MTQTTDQITPDSELPQTEPTGKKKHQKEVIVDSNNYGTLPKGRYTVENGLRLYVYSQTCRSWVFRYKMDGRRHDYSIGSANAISLASAKAKAIKLKAMVLNGINPMVERQKQAAKSDDPVPLFRVLAKDAIALFADVRQWKNPKHAAQWASTIETYAFPHIGRKLVNLITRDDILAILRPIWHDKTETAKRVRGRLENIFDYAISKGYCKENPARWKANL
ncbi:MAG: tyrosine-type recombinase/integrase, partial [Sutterella sp.]